MNHNMKMKIHNIVVITTPLNATANQVIQNKLCKINAMNMKYLRRIAGKAKWDRITNYIRKVTNQEPIMKNIERRQHTW